MARNYKLNTKQMGLLKLIYKFRFVNSELLARHKGISRSAINYSLDVLKSQGLIDRRYDNTKKINGKSAAYYLTVKGIKLLKEHVNLNDKIVHTVYANHRVTDNFIDEKLLIFHIYLVLRTNYPNVFNTFTAAESAGFPYLPEPKPSLYLSRQNPATNKPNDYLLELVTDGRLWAIRNKLEAYIDHFDSNKWNIGNELPTILLVCPDVKIEKRVLKYLDTRIMDFDVLVTTSKALISSSQANLAIWSDELEPETLLTLG